MKSFGSHFPVVQTSPLERCETRNGSRHGGDDLHGGLQTSYVIAMGCEGRTLSLLAGLLGKWALLRQCQTCRVRPGYPRPRLAQSRREAVTLCCKKVGYSFAQGGARDGSQLHECLTKRGRLVRSVFEDFSLSPWIFSSGFGFVATNWILVFQTAWAAAFSWKESSPLFQVFFSLLPALLARAHVGNALTDLRFDHVRIYVSAYHMTKHRVLGISECADASSVPHCIVNLLSTSGAK